MALQTTRLNNAPNLSDEDVYLNINIHNDTSETIPAKLSITNQSPIVHDQSKYKLSIIRFDIPSTFLQKFIFQDDYYSVTLRYPDAGYVSQVFLQLKKFDFVQNTATPNLVAFYRQMVFSINEAFTTAYNDIVAQYEIDNGVGSWALSGGPQEAPFIYYDEVTRLFTIYVLPEYQDTNVNRIEVWMNWPCYDLFLNIWDEFYGFNQPDGLDCRMVIVDQRLNNKDIGGTNYLSLSQEFEALEWYDTYKILLVSRSMKVRKEYEIDLKRGGQQLRLPVIASFNYQFDSPNLERIVYSPTAEYRFIDILDNTPLHEIDIEFFIESKTGEIFPMRLFPGENGNALMLLRKK